MGFNLLINSTFCGLSCPIVNQLALLLAILLALLLALLLLPQAGEDQLLPGRHAAVPEADDLRDRQERRATPLARDVLHP